MTVILFFFASIIYDTSEKPLKFESKNLCISPLSPSPWILVKTILWNLVGMWAWEVFWSAHWGSSVCFILVLNDKTCLYVYMFTSIIASFSLITFKNVTYFYTMSDINFLLPSSLGPCWPFAKWLT